jgi:hypothetical protein
MAEVILKTQYDDYFKNKQYLLYGVGVFVVYYVWVNGTTPQSLRWVNNTWLQLLLFLMCAFISERNGALGLLVALAVVMTIFRYSSVNKLSEKFTETKHSCYDKNTPQDKYEGEYGKVYDSAAYTDNQESEKLYADAAPYTDKYQDDKPYSDKYQDDKSYEKPYENTTKTYYETQGDDDKLYDKVKPADDGESVHEVLLQDNANDDMLADGVSENGKQSVEDVKQIADIVKNITEEVEKTTDVKLSPQKKYDILKEVTTKVKEISKTKNIYKFDVVRVCYDVYKRRVN